MEAEVAPRIPLGRGISAAGVHDPSGFRSIEASLGAGVMTDGRMLLARTGSGKGLERPESAHAADWASLTETAP